MLSAEPREDCADLAVEPLRSSLRLLGVLPTLPIGVLGLSKRPVVGTLLRSNSKVPAPSAKPSAATTSVSLSRRSSVIPKPIMTSLAAPRRRELRSGVLISCGGVGGSTAGEAGSTWVRVRQGEGEGEG